MSSSGNATPQSTTIISSPYSKAVMFIPILSSPPSGIILTLGSEFLGKSLNAFIKVLPINEAGTSYFSGLIGLIPSSIVSKGSSAATTSVSTSLLPGMIAGSSAFAFFPFPFPASVIFPVLLTESMSSARLSSKLC